VNRALVLLIVLQLRGWLRYLGRNLRTVRGALTALLGGVFFGMWMLTVLVAPDGGVRIDPETLRRNGPAFLVAYCLMNVFLTSGERAIYFSPGEVNFLFAGPFGRREILGYKVLLTLLVSLPSTLIVAALVRVHATWFLAAYVALLLAVLFQQLFGMALNLIITSVGARAYSRGRQLILTGLIVLAAVALLQSAGTSGRWQPRELLVQMAGAPVWQALSAPLRWFFDAFLAERLWPDLILYASLALAVDLVLLGVVFALDANYLEAAAASSARIYGQIQRFRRGGMAAAGRGGTARFSLPDLPYLGGVGPVLWRQLTTASRGLGRLAVVLALIGTVIVVPVLTRGDDGDDRAPGAVLAGLVIWLTVFLTHLVPFDFRGDVDRIAALKSLPLVAWRLTLGQLLAPVLLVTITQWAVLAVAAMFRGQGGGLMVVLAAFAPPFNLLLFSLENLLFLRFPMRVMASAPGDFQAVGRNLLFMFAKLATLLTVGVGAALTGVLAWMITRLVFGLPVTGFDPEQALSLAYITGAIAAWLFVSASGLAFVPLISIAFKAFDVTRDTPP
jgi:Putative ABC exporter